MADKRVSTDIKLGALYGADWPNASGLPRPDPTRGPVFVSYEETLRRDLAIINARTEAELGPRPPVEPVQVKPRIDAKGQLLPPLEHAAYRTTEEDAMKINQTAVITAMTSGLLACEPSTQVVTNQSLGRTETRNDLAGENGADSASASDAKCKKNDISMHNQ